MNPLKHEPVLTVLMTLVTAAVGLLVAFGVALTDVQILALSQFVEAAIVAGLWVRSQVTPKAHQS